MSQDKPSPEVTHNAEAGRFEATVDGQTSYASYVRQGDRMVIDYAYVPPPLRGTGLAERVVRAALENARSDGLSVVPRCSYVASFISRHKEYHDLLER